MVVINYGHVTTRKGKKIITKEYRWELEDEKFEELKKTGFGLYPYRVHSIEHYPGTIAENA